MLRSKSSRIEHHLALAVVLVFCATVPAVAEANPFRDEEVRIPTADPNVTLAGTLSVPSSPGPHPAVLFLTGSGGHTRAQVNSGLPMFDVLGDHMAERGLVVLRVDDRGTGSSTGPGVRDSTLDDRVTDARAAFDYLVRRPEVDPEKVGILGHSEGAMNGTRVANHDQRVAFLVLLAPPSMPGAEIWVRQQGDILRRDGEMPAKQIRSIEDALRGMVRHIGLEGNTDEGFFEHGRAACLAWGDPPDEVTVEFVNDAFGDLRQTWYEQFFAADPRPELQRLRVPLLALFGGADQQVTVDLNVAPFVASMIEGGNDAFTVTVLPDEGHFFMTGDGLAPNEHVHGQMKVSRAALDAVTDWLSGRLAIGGAPASEKTVAGSVLWTFDVGEQIWTPLALEAGVLFFGDDEGTLHALDLTQRQLRWRFETAGRIRSAATVAGGSVLFASDDGFLYAVDRESGKERWKLDLGSSELERRLPASGPPYVYDYLHSSPTVEDGTVYVGSADKKLYAVDAETGRVRWSFATQGPIRSSPAVSGGMVYFGSWDGNVYAVSAASGEKVWSYETGAPIQGSPAVAGGRVIVGSRSARLLALDAASGEVEWTHVHADGSWVESSPVVEGDVVYVGSSDALALLALDARSGAEVWRFKTGGWSWGTPVVTDEVVYIGSISASPYYSPLAAGFFAVDRQTGEERWRMTPDAVEGYINGGVFAAPVVDEGIVYVASLDGLIHAIRE